MAMPENNQQIITRKKFSKHILSFKIFIVFLRFAKRIVLLFIWSTTAILHISTISGGCYETIVINFFVKKMRQ